MKDKYIYVIIDRTYEFDDFCTPDGQIKYISTNKNEAIDYFHRIFDCYAKHPNDKYCYNADLEEWPNGWNKMDELLNKCENAKTIISISNCKDETD